MRPALNLERYNGTKIVSTKVDNRSINFYTPGNHLPIPRQILATLHWYRYLRAVQLLIIFKHCLNLPQPSLPRGTKSRHARNSTLSSGHEWPTEFDAISYLHDRTTIYNFRITAVDLRVNSTYDQILVNISFLRRFVRFASCRLIYFYRVRE